MERQPNLLVRARESRRNSKNVPSRQRSAVVLFCLRPYSFLFVSLFFFPLIVRSVHTTQQRLFSELPPPPPYKLITNVRELTDNKFRRWDGRPDRTDGSAIGDREGIIVFSWMKHFSFFAPFAWISRSDGFGSMDWIACSLVWSMVVVLIGVEPGELSLPVQICVCWLIEEYCTVCYPTTNAEVRWIPWDFFKVFGGNCRVTASNSK